jgi:hypothetical protein
VLRGRSLNRAHKGFLALIQHDKVKTKPNAG